MSGTNKFVGELNASQRRFGIAVSRFNESITERLLQAAVETLLARGAQEQDLRIVRVPGAFELPLAVQRMASGSRPPDALIALGCVIQGGTPHFEYVCNGCTTGLMQVSLKYAVPVAFGILTTDTLEQALDRAGGKEGNKGADAALTAIEMINVLRYIQST